MREKYTKRAHTGHQRSPTPPHLHKYPEPQSGSHILGVSRQLDLGSHNRKQILGDETSGTTAPRESHPKPGAHSNSTASTCSPVWRRDGWCPDGCCRRHWGRTSCLGRASNSLHTLPERHSVSPVDVKPLVNPCKDSPPTPYKGQSVFVGGKEDTLDGWLISGHSLKREDPSF